MPDAFFSKTPNKERASWRRKATLVGNGIQLGGTVKSSAEVRYPRISSEYGPMKALVRARKIEKKVHGTRHSSAILGSQ
ncbi:hypothetical protein FCM35_KLT05541 [Carex littledalei]|uniref:Uncharacterized protein n=1 Tax=Carex littledalei TaxID=544730 RepID=A0A833VKL1_9POAL|nr:hypothetical protein FCM35_KLT05541 [Carex littledalei]